MTIFVVVFACLAAMAIAGVQFARAEDDRTALFWMAFGAVALVTAIGAIAS